MHLLGLKCLHHKGTLESQNYFTTSLQAFLNRTHGVIGSKCGRAWVTGVTATPNACSISAVFLWDFFKQSSDLLDVLRLGI